MYESTYSLYLYLGNMGVMMYLGQGGPHSVSASSLFLKLGDKNIITIKCE